MGLISRALRATPIVRRVFHVFERERYFRSSKKHNVAFRDSIDRLKVGPFTYGTIDCGNVSPDTTLTIGAFCSIARGVKFLVSADHAHDKASTYPLRTRLTREGMRRNFDVASKGSVVVGNDVWIGTDAIVLSGVTIGNGAVIGAGSIVTRDIPAYSICAGNPARLIRYRFDEHVRGAMERIAWWNWPRKLIVQRMDDFYGPVEAFVARYDPRPAQARADGVAAPGSDRKEGAGRR